MAGQADNAAIAGSIPARPLTHDTMPDLAIDTSDAIRSATLTVRVVSTPMFRAQLWLAAALIWLAGQVIGLEVDIEHR